MKNKKGITLIEIIISVSLISIVMLFLFRLFMDMQYEENDASYAKENQLVRAEIIKKVQEDFMNLGLKNAVKNGNNIVFTFQNNSTKTLYLAANSVNYNSEQTWNLVSSNENTSIELTKIKIEKLPTASCTGSSCPSYLSFRIIVPITTGNSENIIDDIEFFYIGRRSDMQ